MSQLHSPAALAGSSRPVHALPSAKCSNCNQPVPLSQLSDHVCSTHQRYASPPKDTMPPQQTRLRTNGYPSSLSRPSIGMAAVPDVSSHVPRPSQPGSVPRPDAYMPGGESGMAGVGRRAFQAAADPVTFVSPQHPHNGPAGPPMGMQGRRPYQPQFLDINGVSGRGTPPLSPNSSRSSPHPQSPLSPPSQFPINRVPAIAASRTPSPTPRTRMSSSHPFSKSSHSPPARNNPPPTSPTHKLPFFEKYKDTLGHTQPTVPTLIPKVSTVYPHIDPVAASSPTESDSSGIRLAYDRDDGEVGDEPDHVSSSSHSVYSGRSMTPFTRDDQPVASPRRSHTTSTAGPRGGPGGVASPLSSMSPPRASTTRSVSDARGVRRGNDKHLGSRPRVCIHCNHVIENGRWIKMDMGKGVLCEGCWKNRYLPKCRRCDKLIEEAAISSSDGQLKGKYHRECFTCATCHKPFPDKSFYVYDGQPMCAFHYHEANRSLCVAGTCGKPIEGPCAITFVGDRYHPACLRCGHVGCEERLEDYWEVDGMMLCERHAQRHEQDVGEEDEEAEERDDFVGELGRLSSLPRRPTRLGARESRGQKRTTQLINLTGFGQRI